MILLAALLAQTVDVEPGFSGVFFEEGWGRLIVTLQNPGEEREVVLRVTVSRGVGPPLLLRRPFAFPARSRRRVTWDVWMEPGFQVARADLLDAEGRALASAERATRVARPSRRQVLVVGDGAEALGRQEAEEIVVLRTPADRLPDDLPPLLAADVIVFPEPLALESAQEEALRRWMENGGTLIFSAGSAPASLRRPFWTGICPAELGPPSPEGGVEARPKPGSRAFPKRVSRAERGRGTVIFHAAPFDGSVRDDALGPRGARAAEETPPERIQAAILRRDLAPHDPGPRLPEMLLGVVVLAVYAAGIGPVTFLLLKRRNRARGGATSFALSTAGACLFVVLWGGLAETRPPKLLHHVWADRGLIQTITFARGGGAGELRMSVDGAVSSAPELFRFESDERPDTPSHGEAGRLRIPLFERATRTVHAARVPRPEEILVTARWVDGEIELKNAGTWPLLAPCLVAGDRVLPLAPLRPGQTRRVSMADALPFADWARGHLNVDADDPSSWDWRMWDADCAGLSAYLERVGEVFGGAKRLGIRGIDRSGDPRAALLGRFGADLSGLRVEPAAEVEVVGVLCVPVEGP